MNFRNALESDMMIHSHPVKVPAKNAHEIDSIFDDISYFKVGGRQVYLLLYGMCIIFPRLHTGICI